MDLLILRTSICGQFNSFNIWGEVLVDILQHTFPHSSPWPYQTPPASEFLFFRYGWQGVPIRSVPSTTRALRAIVMGSSVSHHFFLRLNMTLPKNMNAGSTLWQSHMAIEIQHFLIFIYTHSTSLSCHKMRTSRVMIARG